MAQVEMIDANINHIGVSVTKCSGLVLGFAAFGTVTFWLPDVIIHLQAGPNLDSRHGWAITLFAPAAFLLAYVVARGPKVRYQPRLQKAGAHDVVRGLAEWWVVYDSRRSGIRQRIHRWHWRLATHRLARSVIPVVTFILASYDGSLLALLAVTLGSLISCGVRATLALWNADGTGSSAAQRSRNRTVMLRPPS